MPGVSLREAEKSSGLARARKDIQRLLAGPEGKFEEGSREEAEALERLVVLVDRLARLRSLSHKFHSVEISPYVKMAIRATSSQAPTKVS